MDGRQLAAEGLAVSQCQDQPGLFDEIDSDATGGTVPACVAPQLAAASATSYEKPAPRAPRLRRPQRDQGDMYCESLDQRVEADHPVRAVWAFVEQLDLSSLLQPIKAVEGHQGRDANDPRMLLALWLYATVEGIGNARELDRRCDTQRAFQWLCGGVSVNYHTLSDFRVEHVEELDALLTQALASLTHEGLVDVNVVAQDGMRIRASAGSDSFRREGKLEEHLAGARKHLENLKAELELAPNQLDARRKAAQQRAAQEKQERLEQALQNLEKVAESREKRKKGDGEKARASSTDPEARRMKMPDGGTRPAYNAQFATDVESGLIVGVHATNAGNDANELKPMLEAIQENFGRAPQQMLVDGGYSTRDNAALAAEVGTELLTPIREEQKQLDSGKDPYAPKKGDNAAMKKLRERMKEPETKATYRLRGQSAEWVNANARRCDLYMLRVRGLQKVRAVLLLFVLAHNLSRAEALRRQRSELSEPAK